MKRIESMEELRALPDGTVIDLTGPATDFDGSHRYYMLDWKSKREIPSGLDVTVFEPKSGATIDVKFERNEGHGFRMTDRETHEPLPTEIEIAASENLLIVTPSRVTMLIFNGTFREVSIDPEAVEVMRQTPRSFSECDVYELDSGEAAGLFDKLLELAHGMCTLGYTAGKIEHYR